MIQFLVVNFALSSLGFYVTFSAIPRLKDMFLKAGLKGLDMSKPNKYDV